jgi:hypothetical protein
MNDIKNPYVVAFMREHNMTPDDKVDATEFMAWMESKHGEFKKLKNLSDVKYWKGHNDSLYREFLSFLGVEDTVPESTHVKDVLDKELGNWCVLLKDKYLVPEDVWATETLIPDVEAVIAYLPTDKDIQEFNEGKISPYFLSCDKAEELDRMTGGELDPLDFLSVLNADDYVLGDLGGGYDGVGKSMGLVYKNDNSFSLKNCAGASGILLCEVRQAIKKNFPNRLVVLTLTYNSSILIKELSVNQPSKTLEELGQLISLYREAVRMDLTEGAMKPWEAVSKGRMIVLDTEKDEFIF